MALKTIQESLAALARRPVAVPPPSGLPRVGASGVQKPKRKRTLKKGGAISPATAQQRLKVAGLACLVCAQEPCDPAHLIDRSLSPATGDDPLAVIHLCRACHSAYDAGQLDLSPFLEPYFRAEIAHAVEAVGLFGALRRITGKHWVTDTRSLGVINECEAS